MVSKALGCALLAAGAMMAASAPANAATKEAWARPGVSYLKFRTDSAECLYYIESKAPVDLPLVDTIFEMDMAVSGGAADLHNYVDAYSMRGNKNWRTVRYQVKDELEKCLTDRGYRRFRLTRDEQQHLGELRSGTNARQTYIWRIGASPR